MSAVDLDTVRFVQILSQPPLLVGGEVDAVVGSRPLYLGDRVVVTPEELLDGTLSQRWRSASDLANSDLVVEWTEVSERLQFQLIPRSWRAASTEELPGSVVYQWEGIVQSPRIENPLTAQGKLHLPLETLGAFPGQPVQLYQKTESEWEIVPWLVNAETLIGSTETINLAGRFSVQTVPETALEIVTDKNGKALITFPVEPGIQYELWSSADWSNWNSEQVWTPAESGNVLFEADIEMEGSFFYRLVVDFIESEDVSE